MIHCSLLACSLLYGSSESRYWNLVCEDEAGSLLSISYLGETVEMNVDGNRAFIFIIVFQAFLCF